METTTSANWLVWALLSAVFAAATAILAKIGLDGVDSDYATLIRTVVIGVVLSALVYATGKWRSPASVPPRAILFLTLSGLATGASWICYFRALKIGEAYARCPGGQVVGGPGGALCGDRARRAAGGEGLGGHRAGRIRCPAAQPAPLTVRTGAVLTTRWRQRRRATTPLIQKITYSADVSHSPREA